MPARILAAAGLLACACACAAVRPGAPDVRTAPPMAPSSLGAPAASASPAAPTLVYVAIAGAQAFAAIYPGAKPEISPVHARFDEGEHVRWNLVRADALGTTVVDPDEGDPDPGALLLSEPARTGAGVPGDVSGRLPEPLRARADAVWARLADGTVLVIAPFQRRERCGDVDVGPDGKPRDTSFDCEKGGWTVAAIRGPEVRVAELETTPDGC